MPLETAPTADYVLRRMVAQALQDDLRQRADLLTAAAAMPLGPKDVATPVVVNHGRWVIPCDACNSALVGCPSDRRFLCVQCLNVAVDGVWRPVTWPRNWQSIDDELCKRPDPENRNWFPGETLTNLRDEHAEAVALAESVAAAGNALLLGGR